VEFACTRGGDELADFFRELEGIADGARAGSVRSEKGLEKFCLLRYEYSIEILLQRSFYFFPILTMSLWLWPERC